MKIKKIEKTHIIVFLIIVSFTLKIINNLNYGYWYDELLSFYIADPSISFNELSERSKKYDDNLELYFWILRFFFQIFGYAPENGRYLSVFLSTVSVFVVYKIFFKFYSNKYFFLYIFLFSINIFIIWQAKETRVASLVLLIFLINLFNFKNYLYNKNYTNLFLLFFTNQILIQLHPFLILILLSQIIFFLFNKFDKKIIILISINLLLFIFLNYDYINFKLETKSFHYGGDLNYKFFINYFFRTFFGSIWFGAINLIIFAISIIIYVNELIKFQNTQNLKFYLFLNIIFTYGFIVLFSLIFFGINIPRYFIYLIPIIIFFQVDLFKRLNIKNSIIFLFITLNLINLIIKFDDFKIRKFNIQDLKKNIEKVNIRRIYIGNDLLFNNYFNHLKFIKKDFHIIDDLNSNNFYPLLKICINNKNLPGPVICQNTQSSFVIKKITKKN